MTKLFTKTSERKWLQKHRAPVKALTWHTSASIISFAVFYVFTGSIGGSLLVTVVLTIILYFYFILHDKLWDKIVKESVR